MDHITHTIGIPKCTVIRSYFSVHTVHVEWLSNFSTSSFYAFKGIELFQSSMATIKNHIVPLKSGFPQKHYLFHHCSSLWQADKLQETEALLLELFPSITLTILSYFLYSSCILSPNSHSPHCIHSSQHACTNAYTHILSCTLGEKDNGFPCAAVWAQGRDSTALCITSLWST